MSQAPFNVDCVFDASNFVESTYLTWNKDVRDAVSSGKFRSGSAHFEKFGRFEQRKFRREIPTELRRNKLDKLRPLLRHELPCDESMGIPSYLTAELQELARISRTDKISSHQYDKFGMELINKNIDGIGLDCGAGMRPVYYSNVVNFEIVAYDTTDVLGVGEQLPFKDNSFDFVISVAVLEHVQNPFVCAKEISRVLKPGGELYCSVPFLQPYHGYPHHYFNATWQGLERLFDADLKIAQNFVPALLHPLKALTWFINCWLNGLPDSARLEFASLTVRELSELCDRDLSRSFASRLTLEKQRELACGNSILARKP